jgi:hypothetical protein
MKRARRSREKNRSKDGRREKKNDLVTTLNLNWKDLSLELFEPALEK